jgi:hypothetical protein
MIHCRACGWLLINFPSSSSSSMSSLLANSFFSTYPKRTNKTHPTLKDFNFTHFFKELNS